MAIQRQEIHCHHCNGYVSFDMDMELNGNHVLTCPKCGHEHCRVIKDGVITSERWDQRNGNSGAVFYISTSSVVYNTISSTQTFFDSSTTSGSGAVYLTDLWMNRAWGA